MVFLPQMTHRLLPQSLNFRKPDLIPDDIAVVGFNNEPVSQVIKPNLTTIDYPAREIGEIAATSLINKLNNPQEVSLSTIVLKHSLIVRQSSLRIG